ncbi:heavy-metal-associated domain-containing protein [Labrenzia sp. R4_2]|uniref:heavy-metal-associated domain-containing protein n=1 Tax=Labrenzia sp. R4_2 TaxID=2821107 RepID=UPI001ADB3192|nr:heavy-metal-associated domain-containing protein [Labrenzia sp. R4_2]MBO9422977.1 heavy-metal-associated domain-containing protein [Labrenzia sp. R4_2]
MKFSVPDMSCGHCVAAIEKAVLSKDPAAIVLCDLEQRTVDIEAPQTADELVEVIRAAGYELSPLATS